MKQDLAKIVDLASPDLLTYPQLAQTKYDGLRVKIEVTGPRIRYFSKEGQRLTSLEHLTEEVRCIVEAVELRNGFIDCEGLSTRASGYEAALSILARADFPEAKLVPFDMFDALRPDERQTVRLARLAQVWSRCTLTGVLPAHTWTVHTPAELTLRYASVTSAGGEGIVTRNPNAAYGAAGAAQRWKNSLTLDLPIVAVIQSDTNKGTAAALLCMDGEREVRVGTGFTPTERRLFWEMRKAAVGQIAEVKVLGRTASGVLRSASFIRLRPDKNPAPTE